MKTAILTFLTLLTLGLPTAAQQIASSRLPNIDMEALEPKPRPSSAAQPWGINISYIGGVQQSGANVIDPTNNALRVNCVIGCGSGGGGGDVNVTDRASRLLGVVYGSQGQQLQQSTANFNLLTELRTGATAYDARQIRLLTSSDVVSSAQSGTWNINALASITNPIAATQSGVWTVSGSGTFTVGGTVSINAIPAGANNIGDVDVLTLPVLPAGNNNIGDVDVATLPSVTIGTFPDNEPFNVAQVGGSAVSTAAAGVQKVAIVGNANAAFDAANNAAAPANVVVSGVETVANGTNPAAATSGNVRRQIASLEGVTHVLPFAPRTFTAGFNAIAASLTQIQAAPGAGLRLYLTSIFVQTTTATSGTYAFQTGTGTNCGTGTAALFPVSGTANRFNAPIAANSLANFSFSTPLVVPVNTALCVIGVATNTVSGQVVGYIAP